MMRAWMGLSAALLAASCSVTHAATLTTLYAFCAKNACGDGDNTGGDTPLVADSLGNFYGATPEGGQRAGTIFELSFDSAKGKWVHKTLYGFPKDKNGDDPYGRLILDTNGAIYGTTYGGGVNSLTSGVVFKLTPNADRSKWTEHPLYRFCEGGGSCVDGDRPLSSGLTYAGAQSGRPYDGTSPLFGTTGGGGAHGQGTVFELTFNGKKGKWSEAVLHDFCADLQNGNQCIDGAQPDYGLTIDGNGNLFGTAQQGPDSAGVIYELSPEAGGSWQFTTLYDFCDALPCAAFPKGGLTMDASGNLYGTSSGGATGYGTIYKLVPNGTNSQFADLYDFCTTLHCPNGSDPMAGLTMDSLGNFYGTTAHGGANRTDTLGEGGGTVFEFSGGTLQTLYNFCAKTNCGDGEYPLAAVTLDGHGDVFGSTNAGGTHGYGTLLELSGAPRR